MPYKNSAERAAYRKQWEKNNRDKLSRSQALWRAAHPEKAKIYNTTWHEKNPGKRAAATRKWRHSHPEISKAAKEKWRAQNPDRIKISNLRRTLKAYGLTIEQFEDISGKQDHQCVICGSPGNLERHGRLSVDHNHATGALRALLCQTCNITLGVSKESQTRLRLCADYLDQHA